MSLTFPARFMLAAAMNPCPCGYFNDKSRECMCTPPMIQRYVAKISGPLLDRIDIHIEVPAVQYKELRGGVAAEGSSEIRARVLAARERQQERFKKAGEKIYSNAQMTTRQIRAYCELGPDARAPAGACHAAAGTDPRAPTIASLRWPAPSAILKAPRISPSRTSPKPSNTARSTAVIGLSSFN